MVDRRPDLAAGGLTVTPEREKLVDFSPATRTDVSEIVVTGPGAPQYGPRTAFGNMMTQRYLKSTALAKRATSPADIERFHDLLEIFRKYGKQYHLDPLLMAAQGYQESQLRQSARSAAGAIGVMQVTPIAAKEVGIGDITDVAAQGLNPNIWFNNVERVASERIGLETVDYVGNIYKYYLAYQLAMAIWRPADRAGGT